MKNKSDSRKSKLRDVEPAKNPKGGGMSALGGAMIKGAAKGASGGSGGGTTGGIKGESMDHSHSDTIEV